MRWRRERGSLWPVGSHRYGRRWDEGRYVNNGRLAVTDVGDDNVVKVGKLTVAWWQSQVWEMLIGWM